MLEQIGTGSCVRAYSGARISAVQYLDGKDVFTELTITSADEESLTIRLPGLLAEAFGRTLAVGGQYKVG